MIGFLVGAQLDSVQFINVESFEIRRFKPTAVIDKKKWNTDCSFKQCLTCLFRAASVPR